MTKITGPHSRLLLGLLLVATLAFLASGRLSSANDKGYTRTISDREAADLVSGRGLDPDDPRYCEKMRDVCLVAFCGSLKRKGTQPKCWDHCTRAAFQTCQEKKGAR